MLALLLTLLRMLPMPMLIRRVMLPQLPMPRLLTLLRLRLIRLASALLLRLLWRLTQLLLRRVLLVAVRRAVRRRMCLALMTWHWLIHGIDDD